MKTIDFQTTKRDAPVTVFLDHIVAVQEDWTRPGHTLVFFGATSISTIGERGDILRAIEAVATNTPQRDPFE